MPSCKVHPGNVLLLPAQPKLPPETRAGATPFLPTPLLNIHGGEKSPAKARPAAPGCLSSTARVCQGGWGQGRCQGGYQHCAGAAAHPAAEANHNLPVAAQAGSRALASPPRHQERNQALTASGEQCLLQTGVQARGSTTSAPTNDRCKEPRHAQGDAATCLGDRGTKRCQSPGPGRIEMLEGLSSPAAQGRGRNCAAGNLQCSNGSSSSSPHTGMLLPHHPPRFAPSSPETWQCPP